jgi:N-acetylneuraminate lyase
MTNPHGILPALLTPFDEQYRVNIASLELLLERVYAAGVHGVYVCGQTGEGLLQTVEQRKKVTEVAVSNSPQGKQVVVHVGAYRPEEALELARHAAKTGASAVSSLPLIGNYTFEKVHTYYEKLAAATDLPVLIYFFPDICPAIQTAEQIIELMQIPNVVGLKFTNYNLYDLETMKQAGKLVLNGRDEVLAAGLLMGADGGVGTFYNTIPGAFVELYDLARKSQWEETRAVQQRINTLIRLTLRFPMLQAVKQMLTWSGIDCGPCLMPRRALTLDEKELFQSALSQSIFQQESFSLATAK